ncbi:MAG: FtsW/RodA/SpoVE family cell cycle protein [Solibacillus sp.]
MPSKKFLQQVTSFIRSKEARGYVEEELQQHLAHAKKAWITKGYSDKEAEQKAIAEMGSATQLGKAMDKIHRPKWDFWLIGAVLLLIAASFIPILTADYTVQFGQDITSFFVERKIIHTLVALITIATIMYVDYRKIERFSTVIYAVALLLLVMILYMPNRSIQGEAMLAIGPIRMQAWTVLPLLLVAFVGFFTKRKWNSWQLLGLFILPLYFFMLLPNLAVTLLYIVVVAVLFCFSYFSRRVKRNVLLVVTGMGVAGLGSFIYAYHHLLAPYQTARIAAFLQPELYAETEGYLILQLKAALAAAGWFGTETMYTLPDAHTDYALVQLIQAYGYAAGSVVIVAILAISLRILWIVRTMPQSFGKLLVIASVTLYSFQSLYSILMVIGLLPLTGIPLPFISYGLTPLLLNAILIGLVLSVYRRKGYARGRGVMV